MDRDNTKSFVDLSDRQKIHALVGFSHELTIAARGADDADSNRGSGWELLRAINEIQHRISAHVLALLTEDLGRYPDEVLVRILLDHDDQELRRLAGSAFARVLARLPSDAREVAGKDNALCRELAVSGVSPSAPFAAALPTSDGSP